MDNVSIPCEVLVWNGSDLLLSPENHVFDYSQTLYCHGKQLTLEANFLHTVADDKKLLVVELEHFQCPHGVSLIETESSLAMQKAAVLVNYCYFIGEDNQLYQFRLSNKRDRGTYKAEKVLKLRHRRIRDVRAGKNHVILLAEQFNLGTSRMYEKLDSLKPNHYSSSKCKKCREDQELRMSILQLEADRKASETEDLLLDNDEMSRLQSSMSQCLKTRLSSVRRTSLARPYSVSILPDFSKSRMVKERVSSIVAPTENSFTFLSMDTVYIEDMRQQYENEEVVEDVFLNAQGQSTDHIRLEPGLEVWVWVDNDCGSATVSNLEKRKEPLHMISMNDKTITAISSGENHSAAVSAIGEIFIWNSTEATQPLEELKIAPLKLGPEQFVFRCESVGDRTFFLVIGRDSKTSLYSWKQGSVLRIPQSDKKHSFINIYIKDGQPNVVQSPLDFVKEKLLLIFKSFQQIRLVKGLCDIFDTIYNLFTHEFDPANVDGKEREVLEHLCKSAKKFYQASCSVQEIVLKLLSRQQSPLELLWEFGQECFLLCLDDFIQKYCIDEAYRVLQPQTTSELEKQVSRLALEQNVDATGMSSQIKNLVLEVLRFLVFLLTKATEYGSQTGDENETLTRFITIWTRKNVLLQRLVTSTKKTKQEAWTNLKLTHLRTPGRFLVDVFRTGENQKIKNIVVEQPRFYLHKITAIYIFHDILVTEEVRGYKSVIKVCPLPLVWVERNEDERLSVVTPEAHYLIEFTKDSNWFSLCCGSWNDILMEGNPVPEKRQGQFEFSNDCWREHLRQKSYSGSWRCGKLCGRGKLTDLLTGDIEDGVFEDDWLNGFGQVFMTSANPVGQSTFYVPSEEALQNKDFYRGVFEKGELNGLAHIRYANDFCYDGFTKNGVPNGFGVMTLNNEAILGDFTNGTVNGYGVICTNKEKMLGEFVEGKLHGLGIMINLDGIVAEGEWEIGKMKKGKIITCSSDGSFPLEYEGETDTGETLCDIGKQGKLRVSKDMYLEGSFTGNLIKRDIKISEAVLIPVVEAMSPVTDMLTSNGPGLSQWSVPVEKRWTSLFEAFIKENIGLESTDDIELVRNIWDRIVSGMIRGKALVHGNVSTGFCDSLERIPHYEEFWNVYYFNNAAEYWRLSQDNEYHPLKRLMNGVVEVFTASYSDISAHPVMYSHCVLETKHFIKEVYRIYRMLFPSFPESLWAHAPRETDKLPNTPISSPDSSPEKTVRRKVAIHVPVPCSDFIAETYFCRCSPILFTIYSFYNMEREEKYWNKAMYLNAHTDVKLLTHLEVNQDLWPIAISNTNTRDLDRPIIVTTARDKFYRRAVDSLQRLPSETNPSTKLRLLAETYTVMEQCIAEQTEVGDRHVFTADSLLPAFIYVVIRAQIRHLGSEILFLDDFSKEWRGEGAIGLLFTILQSAYMYICNEKSLV